MDQNIDFYKYGIEAYKKDKLAELKSRKHRLKDELLRALNEPMDTRIFKQISDDMALVLSDIEEIEKERI
jgi:hypothetical protein|nr:MAG TPA: hypothetical protein [Caudoviricetes sp.]